MCPPRLVCLFSTPISTMKRACFVCLFLCLATTFFAQLQPPLNGSHSAERASQAQAKTESLFAHSRAGVRPPHHEVMPADPVFSYSSEYDSGGCRAVSVALKDVNADGKLDLLVTNQFPPNELLHNCSYQDSNANGSIGVLLGNGDGTFQAVVTDSSGGVYANSVAVADVNGDGKPDLLVANSCADSSCVNGNVGVLLGNGDGTFQSAVTYSSGGLSAYSVAVADVNGDGKPDLLVANACAFNEGLCDTGSVNGSAGVLLGNGDGTFQPAVSYLSPGQDVLSLVVGDVNQDGKPDLLLYVSSFYTYGDYLSLANLLLGNGDGTFQAATSYFFGGDAYHQHSHGEALALGDVNGDEKPDLLMTSTCYGYLVDPGPCEKGTVDGSVGVFLNVSPSPTSTSLSSSVNPSTFGQSVTFSATVTSKDSGTPTGTVSFYDSTTLLGTGTLNNGTAQYSTSTLTVGSHSITAVYSGDSNFLPSTSPVLYQVVQGAIAVLSPTSLIFPDQTIFTTSPAKPVTLTNTGLGALLISKIAVTGPFIQTNNCPSSIGPGVNCTISVKFHPGNKGVFHGAVSVTDNAPGSPQKVPLTGTGTYVQLVPTKLNFGSQPVGTRSLAKKITLTNKGNSAVKITGIAITGTDAGDFAETNTCGKSVASGASCFIKVTFKPLVKGKRTADVSVYDNGGGSPQQAMLIGTGT
jgi:hypothetical protein